MEWNKNQKQIKQQKHNAIDVQLHITYENVSQTFPTWQPDVKEVFASVSD